jgi:hypothetical protein
VEIDHLRPILEPAFDRRRPELERWPIVAERLPTFRSSDCSTKSSNIREYNSIRLFKDSISPAMDSLSC